MIEYPDSPYRVPSDGSFSVADCVSHPQDDVPGKKQLRSALKDEVKAISELQRKLYADNRFSLLIIFQALDAAGKDGTIRAVMSGVNPAGCRVSSFKSPSSEELDHDFLWRTSCRLPERGIIGIFNRSYYEEVLAVRVHPEYLEGQRLPFQDVEDIWEERYQSIRDQEAHLARNGTRILKFWLNVSKDEQKKRFMERLTNPEKHWKFSKSDLASRQLWSDYMDAFEQALNATSTGYAPWYAIPADNKPWMRLMVARLVKQELESLPLTYPDQKIEEIQRFDQYKQSLMSE